jgi:hypothetical protein
MIARKPTPAGWRRLAELAVCGVMALAAAVPARAQGPDPQSLSFDRPEAWALKYFSSATLLSGFEAPRTRSAWSVSLGVEAGWLPPISSANRFVGFDGTKPEDLNKAPLFLRPRVTVGLPAGFSATVAVVPPVHIFGITPRLVALAVEHAVYRSDSWTVGLRAYGQIGTVRGAYTCPPDVLGAAPGSAGNLYGCQAESSDTATLRYAGVEVGVGHEGRGRRRVSPHAGVGLNYVSAAFQVNALTFGFQDLTHYTTHGLTVSFDSGIGYRLARGLGLSVDAFYTPLAVNRPAGREIDGLFNVRALFTYRLR